MKILFVSSVRYPTSKAYGVTISETMRAARDMGYQVEIVAPSTQIEDEFGTRIIASDVSMIKFAQGRATSFLFNRLKFIHSSVLVARDAARQFREKDYDFIWLRNPYTAAVLRCYRVDCPVIIEVHHTPNRLQALLLKFLIFKSPTRITVLTSTQLEKLNTKYGISSRVIPMGVPKEFYLVRQIKTSGKQKFKVGLIGKATSSGNDNGLFQLSECILLALTRFQDIEFYFIGLENEAQEFIKKRIENSGLGNEGVKFKDHVTHSQIINELRNLDVGIIPYIDSPYNNSRFPIKSLEYAASGTLILASDIPAHRSLFPSRVAYFYDPLNPDSFCENLSKILMNPLESSLTRNRAQDWSLDYTYVSRVEMAKEYVFS